MKSLYQFHLLLCCLLIYHSTHAQDYSYMHYNMKDGLVGEVVYCMYQDKEGFIWFGTETGVSRFDGTHFKNFTAKDGLPGNTIIRIYGDSLGRVWLLPFKHTICYYYKGRIHNQQNDPVLKKLKLDSHVVGIGEDKQHHILLMDASNLYLIDPLNEAVPVISRKFNTTSLVKLSRSDSGFFYILDTYKVYKSDVKTVRFYTQLQPLYGGAEQTILHDNLLCWMVADTKIHIRSAKYNLDYDYPTPPVNSLHRVNDSIICMNTTKGAVFLNILRRRIASHFLPNRNVSNFLVDMEGGTWFSTFNDGVYRLHSGKFKNISHVIPGGQKMSVYDLEKDGDIILVGSDMGYLQMVVNESVSTTSLSRKVNILLNNPVSAIKKRGDILAIGCGPYVLLKRSSSGYWRSGVAYPIKGIDFKSPDELIVATSHALFSLGLRDLKFTNIWHGRTTALLCRDNAVYFGGLNGLYLLNPDKTIIYFGDTSNILRNRITAIRKGVDSAVWVATDGGGIIGLKNNRVTWQIDENDGLSSNACRCLAADTGCIWVGTDKGLNRVDLRTNPVTITKYASSDGLAADLINTILVTGDTVYAGTPEGITYFNKQTVSTFSRCDLKLLGIQVNGAAAGNKALLDLKYGKNNISINFVAISFKAAGAIVYSYRLQGLDTTWKTTTRTSLEFISLPPGDYNLELFATNKFGIKSNAVAIQMTVHAPFWQAGWFMVLMATLIVFITRFIVTRRNEIARNKEAAERSFEQKLQELEQKALRAQMNPHFIFNCLHAVQEFILDKDVISANKYLSNFSHLIRQTLNNSLQPIISLADEIQYLTTYLDLEQLRFKNKFDYVIQADKNIARLYTFLPTMLLQPHVENAIRHGIQNKQNDKGQIDINFYQDGQAIICTIRDNGIGRKAAQMLKDARHMTYPSRGLQLTEQRIHMLNKNLHPRIMLTIDDISDATGVVAGTVVTIRFPLIYNKENGAAT